MDPRLRRLPGVLPLGDDSWISRDEAYAGQMARRDQLIAERPDKVHALLPAGRAGAEELYDLVLARLHQDPGYRFDGADILRPDGVTVTPDRAEPLLSLGRLIQEDLCLMQAGEAEHYLSGAVLCFPAGWTLAQKIGRPLLGIHVPVPEYDERLARGVQRLFDAIRPEQPLWRMNFLAYDNPELHQPRAEGVARPPRRNHDYVRCEKQVLLRLPQSRAVVFAIHSYIVTTASLPAGARAELLALDIAHHG
ncbi:heme-dependent oxidative N-demethylase family protein [Pseudogemmobacter faecipullorum]|uniref:DUF3445 domain-containing protein n=1 Tax=Pseudogemmobacter faecipullorum TaxID=2755041 RepID=A0ABS8CKT7_9RHOB|nr:DUF3445 domain-containing protein [Pseudogemmobacter faecipullorum]MCB5409990.1 DUF3445 domain-containing protein [Pseudogemmobacter faecipullorum]